MTIASTVTSKQYTGNGSTSQFSFPNKIFSASDLIVTLIDLLGNTYLFIGGPTTFANAATGLSYTVQNVDVDTGCLIVMSGAVTTGWTVDLRTQTPELQSTSIKNQGQFLPELHEEAFDRNTREIQDLLRLTYTYGIHGPDLEATPWPALPSAALRKGLALMFDAATGLPTVGVPTTQTLTQGLLGSLLFPRTPAEISAGITPTNLYIPSHDACGLILLQRYGGFETASAATNNAAFAAAVLVSGQIDGTIAFTCDGGTWNFSAAWVLNGSGQGAFGGGPPAPGAGTQGCRIQGFGRPYILFTGIGAGVDCVTLGGSQMPQVVVKDIQLDCGSTGRDGLVIIASNAPILDNVLIKNTVRDGLVLSPNNSLFIEKPKFKDIFLGNIGRHGINISLSGSAAYLAYVNEGTWEHIELRKCAVITAGGTFCNMTAAAGGNPSSAKIANHTWIDCNIDCAYAGSGPVPGVSPFTTDSAIVQNFSIIGGGWESTGGVTPGGSGYGCNVTGTGSWGGLIVLGVLTNSFWAPGIGGIPFNPAITSINDFNYSFARNWLQKMAALFNQPMQLEDLFTWENKLAFAGSTLKKFNQKSTAPASQTDGIPTDGLLHSSVAGATSATCHMQFPLALVSPVPISDFVHSFLLLLSNSKFNNFNGNVTEMYWIQVAPDLATCLATNIKSASSANQIVSVTPTVVGGTTLDIAIVTGTLFATGGGNTTIYGNLHRGAFVP